MLSHSDLCSLAASWLKRSFSAGGHGCQIAFTETRTSFLSGESPDAIGFRVSTHGYGGGSTVVECKVSRSDFMADRNKPHRTDGAGMGRFRYFMVPAGLVSPLEVPDGWGLLHVGERKRIEVIAGAMLNIRDPGVYDRPHDAFGETLLLANLLHRVGDADRLNARLRAADARTAYVNRLLEKEREHSSNLQRRLTALAVEACQ